MYVMRRAKKKKENTYIKNITAEDKKNNILRSSALLG